MNEFEISNQGYDPLFFLEAQHELVLHTEKKRGGTTDISNNRFTTLRTTASQLQQVQELSKVHSNSINSNYFHIAETIYTTKTATKPSKVDTNQ